LPHAAKKSGARLTACVVAVPKNLPREDTGVQRDTPGGAPAKRIGRLDLRVLPGKSPAKGLAAAFGANFFSGW
jgi:hypothetical protein